MPIVSKEPSFVGATVDWQQAMRTAIRSGVELCRVLDLPASLASCCAEHDFPVFAPLPYIRRIKKGDPTDPLLRQILAVSDELAASPGFSSDPVGDRAAVTRQGMLQKYAGRALLITTGVCAIHCRYCFRRHFPYSEQSAHDLTPALDALAADTSITEVLLSGGDPLTLSDQRLAKILEQLAAIPHLKRVRLHSRLPIVIPTRVTSALCQLLRETRLSTWVVVHANHPAELDDETGQALESLVDAGVPTLNQSVLLRGINDDLTTLCELSEALIDRRVTPYYLHLLDRVAGAAHFDVSEVEGVELIEQMRRRLPGYAVPRLAHEVPGEHGKRFLA